MASLPIHFADRTAWDTSESELARAVRKLRGEGRELIDLTVSNPTLCGFAYDADTILGAATSSAETRAAAMTYAPDPRGLRSAREAVAAYYAEHGASVDPDHLILTTSTSEAYTFLFRLLVNAGDEVLVPQPGYPLFDYLGDLNDLRIRHYPLFYDFGWWIDFAELERRIGPRTRALLVVHPNNPTGHTTGASERAKLEELCARRGLALIVDEVFLDYPVADRPSAGRIESFAAPLSPTAQQPLTFVVSGLSKIAALPQVKIGWLACFGPKGTVRTALERLEVIADTMLSVSTLSQLALPAWLQSRHTIIPQIRARAGENLRMLEAAGVAHLPVESGWAAVVRLPLGVPADAAILAREHGVLVHPGSFYALEGRRTAVLSLLPEPRTFARGIEKLKERMEP